MRSENHSKSMGRGQSRQQISPSAAGKKVIRRSSNPVAGNIPAGKAFPTGRRSVKGNPGTSGIPSGAPGSYGRSRSARPGGGSSPEAARSSRLIRTSAARRTSKTVILKRENRPSKSQLLRELGHTTDRQRISRKVEKEELIRLNRFIANAGICSRRQADTYISAGVVKVNGQVVTELGSKVSPTDEVRFDDRLITPERKVYLLMNKPKDVVTTTDDPHAERTVMDIIQGACEERIYPVGRLDRNTTGLLLLTNDGELSKRLTHPSHKVEKVYQVTLDKSVSVNDIQKMAEGIELEDGFIAADAITFVEGHDKDTVGIEIHSGRHRIVRRMFEQLG